MVSKPQWGLSTGVQKTGLKNKGTVRFNITYIFWTNLPRATITYPGVYIEKWHAYRESGVATVSFTYRFGSNKVQATRRRTTGQKKKGKEPAIKFLVFLMCTSGCLVSNETALFFNLAGKNQKVRPG